MLRFICSISISKGCKATEIKKLKRKLRQKPFSRTPKKMSNSTEKTLIEELGPPANPNPSNNPQPPQQRDQAQEWETMARAWLSAFPEGKAVNVSQVEAWIDSNRGSLPSDLQSMPRSDLVDRLLSIQNYMRLPTSQEKETSQIEPPARFQRTDQWLPVYSWLESLDQDEVVKSKEISDWLAANPEIKEQLCSRHSRYHLMHYVKKCHMKILKRREKKHGVQLSGKELALPNNETALTLHTNVVKKQAAPPASSEEEDSGGCEEMGPRTDAIHVNGGVIKFRNRFCNVCGKKAIVRISESTRNPGKLYFSCDSDRCDYFEFWVLGRDEFNLAAVTRVGDDMGDIVLGFSLEIRTLAAEIKNLIERVNSIYAWRAVKKLLILVMFLQVVIVCKI